MIFDIEIDGAPRTVAVESDAPGRYRVVIDGMAHQVHAERAGEFGLSLGISPSGGDASKPCRELQIAPGAAKGELLVTLGGRTITKATPPAGSPSVYLYEKGDTAYAIQTADEALATEALSKLP